MNHHHVNIEDAETTFFAWAGCVKDLRNQIDFILYFETKPLSFSLVGPDNIITPYFSE